MNTPATFRRSDPDAPSEDSRAVLFRALNLANQAHSGQQRKVSGAPYLVHPLNVAKILLDYGFPADPYGAAALLHDTVEDTEVTLKKIRDEFGDEVESMVRSVSYPDKDISWWERRVRAVEGLKNAPERVLVLACADKLDNLSSIRSDLARMGDSVWDKFRAPREMQAWYYRALAEVFQSRRETGTPAARLFDAFRAEVALTFGGSTTGAGGMY